MLTNFKFRIILHLAGIIALVFAGAYVWVSRSNVFLLLLLAGGLGIFLVSLFSLITLTNKKLTDFLLNIRYDDYEAHYATRTGEKSQSDLSSAFNLITINSETSGRKRKRSTSTCRPSSKMLTRD